MQVKALYLFFLYDFSLTFRFHASKMYVKNIDDGISDGELSEYFSRCGTIIYAKHMQDDKGVSKGFGFVCFSTPEEAHKVVNLFHGSMTVQLILWYIKSGFKEAFYLLLDIHVCYILFRLLVITVILCSRP